MKLYDTAGAPNPRRVRIFIAEKNLDIPLEDVSIMKGEHKQPPYISKTGYPNLPALETDDGTIATESAAIQRYIEELHPEPNLLGSNPEERLIVGMWDRRVELNFFLPGASAFRHMHPAMAKLENQIPQWGEACKTRAEKAVKFLDKQLASRDYIALNRFTVADITTIVAIDFIKLARISVPDECTNFIAWRARVNERPSVQKHPS